MTAGFRVIGILDRTLYEVEVTGDSEQPTVGSKRVRALIRQLTGEKVLATPVGPAYIVDPGEAESVLAALCAHSRVTRVSKDAPQLLWPQPLDPCLRDDRLVGVLTRSDQSPPAIKGVGATPASDDKVTVDQRRGEV